MKPIAIGRIVHFVLPNGWHRPAQILDTGAEVRGGAVSHDGGASWDTGEGQLLEVHPIPGEGTGYAELVTGLPIFYARALQGHRARDWHFHEDCKGGRHAEPDPPVLAISLNAPPHLRWSASTMAGGEERLELVHIPGECANCDALR